MQVSCGWHVLAASVWGTRAERQHAQSGLALAGSNTRRCPSWVFLGLVARLRVQTQPVFGQGVLLLLPS